MKKFIFNDFDDQERVYHIQFLGNEIFKLDLGSGLTLEKNESAVLLQKGETFQIQRQVFDPKRRYYVEVTGNALRKVKAYLKKHEAKELIKEYGLRWDFDKTMNYCFVWCACGHNADCPTYGEVVPVEKSELKESALKKLNKHLWIDDDYVLAPAHWLKEKVEYEDGSPARWVLPSRYKVQQCSICQIAYEVQACYESCPWHLRLLAWFWLHFERYIMVPYMHLFMEYPKWWQKRMSNLW